MLNIANITKLIAAVEDKFYSEVEMDEYGALADSPLDEICERSEISELKKYLGEIGIPFGSSVMSRINPNIKYRIWVNIMEGGKYSWGLTPM